MPNRFSPYLELYRRWGLCVIPLQERKKVPKLERWKDYQQRLPDNAELGEWFSDNHANLGIICGAVSGNLCVLDFDTEDLYQGYSTWWEEAHQGQRLIDITPIVHTGGGGYHVYLRTRRLPPLYHPRGDERKIMPDIQSSGGYVVAPPSIHPSGRAYELLNPDIDTIVEVGSLDEIELQIPAPRDDLASPGDRPQWVMKALQEGVVKGDRDTTCFRLAAYFRNKHPADITYAILEGFAAKCKPPIDERTLAKCVRSAYTYNIPDSLTNLTNGPISDNSDISDIPRIETDMSDTSDKTDMSDKSSRGQAVWTAVDVWLAEHEGETFDLDTICRHLDIRDRDGRHHVVKKLSYEVGRQKLEKSDKSYRLIKKSLVLIDWVNAPPTPPLVITWPYGIDDHTAFGFADHVVISPGDVIVLAGMSNQGKTGFCLNLLWNNFDKYPCRLMGNEYEAGKFRRRIADMTWRKPIDEHGKPKFDLIQRYENWKDIIEPDSINIIDWISLSDAFYQIGKIIEGIKAKLRDGIAVIVLQKAAGKELGLGGGFSQHLASLYLAIDKGKLTVVKAKEWYELNVNERIYAFDLAHNGTRFSNIREVQKCKPCNGAGRTARGECQICQGHGFTDQAPMGGSWTERY